MVTILYMFEGYLQHVLAHVQSSITRLIRYKMKVIM